jgi:hypothetical protein
VVEILKKLRGKKLRRILSADHVKRAIDYCMPMVNLAGKHDLRGLDFHIVVLDPAIPFSASHYDVRDALLHEASFGLVETSSKYRDIAWAKAKLSWQHRMSTRQIQEECPFVLASGDTTYFGSVYNHGLVVAVSGLKAWQDEWLATVIMNTIVMLCQNTTGMAGRLEVNPDGFIV